MGAEEEGTEIEEETGSAFFIAVVIIKISIPSKATDKMPQSANKSILIRRGESIVFESFLNKLGRENAR